MKKEKIFLKKMTNLKKSWGSLLASEGEKEMKKLVVKNNFFFFFFKNLGPVSKTKKHQIDVFY